MAWCLKFKWFSRVGGAFRRWLNKSVRGVYLSKMNLMSRTIAVKSRGCILISKMETCGIWESWCESNRDFIRTKTCKYDANQRNELLKLPSA